MAEREPSLAFNGKTLPIYLGLLTIGTAVYTLISAFNAYGFQVERLQAEQTALGEVAKDLKSTVQGLNKSITDLTIILNRVEDRQKFTEDRLGTIEQRLPRK